MKKIKAVCIFILCAAFIQGTAIIAFTHKGENIVYPLIRRIFAEKINIENNSYVEYYNIREYVNGSDVIIVGSDGRVGQSYAVLSDFLKYIKQNVNITLVALEIGDAETVIINDCIYSQNDTEFSEKISALEGLDGMSSEFISFVESLYRINRVMSPDRKITAVGIGLDSTSSAICDVLDELLKPLYSELKGNYKAFVKTDNIDGFVDYFYENGYSKIEIFGDTYEKVKEICDGYDTQRKLGKNTDEKLFQSLSQVAREGIEDKIFAVVLPERLEFGADLRTLVTDVMSKSKNVLMTEIKYSSCGYFENGESNVLNTISFPTLTKDFKVYLIRKSVLEKVTGYYKSVTKSPVAVNEYDFPFSFVITNGTEITPYSESEEIVSEN